jgi:hypothetical protein
VLHIEFLLTAFRKRQNGMHWWASFVAFHRMFIVMTVAFVWTAVSACELLV